MPINQSYRQLFSSTFIIEVSGEEVNNMRAEQNTIHISNKWKILNILMELLPIQHKEPEGCL